MSGSTEWYDIDTDITTFLVDFEAFFEKKVYFCWILLIEHCSSGFYVKSFPANRHHRNWQIIHQSFTLSYNRAYWSLRLVLSQTIMGNDVHKSEVDSSLCCLDIQDIFETVAIRTRCTYSPGLIYMDAQLQGLRFHWFKSTKMKKLFKMLECS